MKLTIDHHTLGIAMAELCVAEAMTPELIELCQTNIANQTQEKELLKMHLRDWYGIEYDGEIDPSGANMLEMLSELSGAEFEIEFMKMFTRHHFRIIIESTKCLARAFHEDLRRHSCEPIVVNQSHDIEVMRGLLCTLYDPCNYGPKGGPSSFLP